MLAYGLREQSLLVRGAMDLTFAMDSSRRLPRPHSDMQYKVFAWIKSHQCLRYHSIMDNCWDGVEARCDHCQVMVASIVTVYLVSAE